MPKKREINLADFGVNGVEKRGRSRGENSSLTLMVWSVGGIVLAACGTEDHGANLFGPRPESGIPGADVAHTGEWSIRVTDGPVKGARIYLDGDLGGQLLGVTDENGEVVIESHQHVGARLVADVNGAVDVNTGKVLTGSFRALPGDTAYSDGKVLLSPLTNLLADSGNPQGDLDSIFGEGVITVGDVRNYLNYDLDSDLLTPQLISRASLALTELERAEGNLDIGGYDATPETPYLIKLQNLFKTVREALVVNTDDDPTNDIPTFNRISELHNNIQGSLHLHTQARLDAHTKIKDDGIPFAAAPNNGNAVEVLVGGGDENHVVYSFADSISMTVRLNNDLTITRTDSEAAERLFGFVDPYGNNNEVDNPSSLVGIFIKPIAVAGEGSVGSLTLYYNFAGTVRILEANLPNSAPAVDADNVDITEEGFFYISFANLINLRVVSTLDASGDFGFEYYVWDGERRSSNVDKPRSENAEHADSLLYGTSANPLLSFNVGGENIAPYIWSTDAMGENLEGTRDRLTPIEATVTEDATNEAGNVERDIYIRFADNNTILSHLITQVALGDAAAMDLGVGDANSVTFDTTYGMFTITRDATEGEIDVKYTLDNSSVLIQRLTAEDTRIEEITLSVFDGVHTSERTISVTIQGADDDNDAATASGDFEGSLMANAAETAEGRIVFENEDNEVLTIQVGSANTAIMPDGNQRVAGENGNGFFTLSYDVTNKVLAWQYEAYNSRYFNADGSIPTAEELAAFNNADYPLEDILTIRVADDFNDFEELTPITATITPPQDDFTSVLMVTTGGTARPSGYYNASGEGLLAENTNGSGTAVGIGTLSGGGEGTLTYAVATGDDITTGLTALGISDIALIARVQVTSTAFSVTSNTLNFIGMNSGNFEAGDFHDVLIKITDQESTETYQLYRVRLSDANEAPEQIEGEEIIITDSSAMQEITLTEAMLAVRDPDRDDSLVDGRPIAITYTVSTATAGGTLMLDDGMGTLSAVALNGTFTLEDLRAGEVSFMHDGSTVDTVTFTLTATSNTQASAAKTYTLGINAGAADFDFGTADDDMDGVVEGDLTVGNTLYAVRTMSDPDGDGDDNLSYQWLRGDTTNGFDIIDDATGGSYVIDEADDGEFLRVIITYTDGEGYDEEVTITTATLVPIADAGNAGFEFEYSDLGLGSVVSVAQTSADPDGDGAGTPTYQWVRAATIDGTYTAIGTQTNSSYTLGEDDDGMFIGVVITYTDAENTVENVTIGGIEVAVEDSGDAGFEFGYETDNDNDYSESLADVTTGSLIRVERTGNDSDGNGNVDSAATYTWQRSSDGMENTFTTIAEAPTTNTYTVTSDDQAMYLRAVVEYTDGEGTMESVPIDAVLIPDAV